MNFDEDIERRSTWTNVALFMVGVAILSFIPKNKDGMPDPIGKQVWEYITQTNNYESWDNWPGYEGMYEGQSPHGAYLKLYVNAEAKEAIDNGDKIMPSNAIVVKENYNKQKELVAITPMYKVDGYNSKAGNWFWAKYSKEGAIQAEGKVGSCIDCHSDAKNNDYLFTALN